MVEAFYSLGLSRYSDLVSEGNALLLTDGQKIVEDKKWCSKAVLEKLDVLQSKYVPSEVGMAMIDVAVGYLAAFPALRKVLRKTAEGHEMPEMEGW